MVNIIIRSRQFPSSGHRSLLDLYFLFSDPFSGSSLLFKFCPMVGNSKLHNQLLHAQLVLAMAENMTGYDVRVSPGVKENSAPNSVPRISPEKMDSPPERLPCAKAQRQRGTMRSRCQEHITTSTLTTLAGSWAAF